MTAILDDALAAIKAGLAGVTPGPWSYESVSEKANDYRVGIACPVDIEGNLGEAVSGGLHAHPHWFDQKTHTFGEWYCETVAQLDECEHSSHGSIACDAAHIARCDPQTIGGLIERLEEAEAAGQRQYDENINRIVAQAAAENERDALRAQVEQLREILTEVYVYVALNGPPFNKQLTKRLAAALAATKPKT